MEMNYKELEIIRDGFDALIKEHKEEIIKISEADDSVFEQRLSFNFIFKTEKTIEDFRNDDIEGELRKIKEIEALKDKIFNTNSHLLLISKRVKISFND